MKKRCYTSLSVLVLALAILAATTAVKAETSVPPPQVTLFDDYGRSCVSLDFSSGFFSWTILQGQGAGDVFTGTGSIQHAGSPWQMVYRTQNMIMTAVYVQAMPHGAGSLWVRSGGTSGKDGLPGIPIISAVYDSQVPLEYQTECQSPDLGGLHLQAQPQISPEETPSENQTVPEATTIAAPYVALIDDYGRSEVCVDFSSGAFTWDILQGQGAGDVFSGTGVVPHNSSPWQMIYMSPTMMVTVVYVQQLPHGAGSLWASGGGGTPTGRPVAAGIPITSALYDSHVEAGRQPQCDGGIRGNF